MGAVLQGLAGFVYLVVTSGTAILIVAGYKNGAATINQLERFATRWVSEFDVDLVFYGVLFLAWLFVSIPAFRLIGEAETNGWQEVVTRKLGKLEDQVKTQSESASTTHRLLQEIRDELRNQNKKST